jgi:hypothetical protein
LIPLNNNQNIINSPVKRPNNDYNIIIKKYSNEIGQTKILDSNNNFLSPKNKSNDKQMNYLNKSSGSNKKSISIQGQNLSKNNDIKMDLNNNF